MSSENQIQLKGDYRYDEKTAGGAISPGHLIEIDSAGDVVVHSTEGGRAARLFAVEDALQGNTLDDDYADDDLVPCHHEYPGSEIQAFLKSGENVSIGDELISAGDGTLIADGSESSGVTVADRIAIALEAKNLSGSGAVDTLIQVLIK